MLEGTFSLKLIRESGEATALYNRVRNTWGLWFEEDQQLKIVGSTDDVEIATAVLDTVGIKPIAFQVIG